MRALVALVAALGGGACSFQDTTQFDTNGTAAAYCGRIVGLEEVRTPERFDGFSGVLGARLTLDLSSEETIGTLTTNDPTGPCSPEPTFSAAPLRTMRALQGDPLSDLAFEYGQIQSKLAWVTSTCRGSMLAVVSLMTDSTVRLRLLKDLSPTPIGADPQPGFCLFPLARSESGCPDF